MSVVRLEPAVVVVVARLECQNPQRKSGRDFMHLFMDPIPYYVSIHLAMQ